MHKTHFCSKMKKYVRCMISNFSIISRMKTWSPRTPLIESLPGTRDLATVPSVHLHLASVR